MKELRKLIDVKSLGTLMFMANTLFIVDYVMVKGVSIDDKTFLLFSNLVTMMITFYFTKKATPKEEV